MKAKDTVIETLDHSHSVYCSHCGEEQGIETYISLVREEQAEISFKAGYKQGRVVNKKHYLLGKGHGIKEVVEWFMANGFDREHWEDGSGYCAHKCPACTLKAKLKEWGVE